MTQRTKILVVDDSPGNLFALKIFLKNLDAECIEATDGEAALRAALQHRFALAILDVHMPGMDGYELARRIRSQERNKELPIIFLSAVYSDNYHVFKGYRAGAVDFLAKPVMPEVLTEKALFFIKIYKQQLRLHQTIHELKRTKDMVLEQNRILQELASQDMLTGLYNRRQLTKILRQEAEECRRHGGDLSVVILDLDYFKKVNDTYGHDFGDYVIKEFAARILSCIRDSDYAFRFGGEEFIVLLPKTDVHGATATAESIRRSCADKLFQHLPHTISMTVSIGVSAYKNDLPDDCREMIQQADIALYHAKNNGRNKVSVYDPSLHEITPQKS
jgi:diguanylate cyclase (GGDEF)-like protein